MNNNDWASLEDFAVLFGYFWHRDFPIDPKHLGARRADWTIHIGNVVRNIADLIGWYPRFESGGRTDAIIRNAQGQDLIALEWEWKDILRKEGEIVEDELNKLQKHSASHKETLLYCGLVTYTHTPNIEEVYKHVIKKWEGISCPLLLVLIDFKDDKKYWSGRIFRNIRMSKFNGKNAEKDFRILPALPWELPGTRWEQLK